MQWDYESVCWMEKNNKNNLPLLKPINFEQSIMKTYVMWLWLNEMGFDLSMENRVEFICKYYAISSQDLLMNILKSDISKEEQGNLISFYYLKQEEIDQLCKLKNKAENEVRKVYEETKKTYHSRESKLLEKIKDENYIKTLVNVNFSKDIKLTPYISLVDNKQMNLYYEVNKGAILALGYDFEIEQVKSYDHEDTLNKLKALGDETRLKMVELILEKYMSASELSLLLDLTIPTIAHHLKVLASAGIISSLIEDEGGSKVRYKIYNPGIDKLIKNINILISGGVK